MAYVVRYRGEEVRCETADEVRALLDPHQAANRAPASRHKEKKIGRAAGTVGTNKLAKLVSGLSEQQRQLLRAIASTDGISADDLRDQLGVPSNRNLAALMTGITKIAKPIGIKSPIRTIAKRSRAHGRSYEYRVDDPSHLREFLRKGGRV